MNKEQIETAMGLGLVDGVEFMPDGTGLSVDSPIQAVSGVDIDRVLEKAKEVATQEGNTEGKSYFEFSGTYWSFDKNNNEVEPVETGKETNNTDSLMPIVKAAAERLQ